jgi:HPt (histidine-containing phosphotransfer) domain-containing protein
MPPDPILNPDAIQALRDLSPEGDAEFLRELIAIFQADAPKQLSQLEEALRRQDAAAALRAAHTLKGSSGNFGAEELARHASGIEAQCKAGNPATALAALPELKKAFAAVTEALRQIAGS